MKRISALLFLCLTHCISSPDNKALKDKKTEENIIKDSNYVSETNTPTKVNKIKTKEDNKIYNIDSIDVKPDFEKGIEKLQKFIRYNYKYPEEELQVKGIVDVNFIVEKDGDLSDIKITKDADFGTGNEAIRVLKKCPKWIPGMHNNRLVRVRYYLTIPIDAYHE
ncbi:energy transducer TonB [Flavobacterium ginsenosidimutans]|uniref:Energy transducer TonB n=1 Tax=Flavobacterium ginsenosidimutans TaxID=687844 RepID=A0ABZ2Q6I4_9FLAO|nr:energy transducer TonB [Flavobacterium ginsenosidimutans]KAF2328986.1 hypothetical protein DM444_18145 [Flavobacterium ginsenosidimutans]